MSRAHDFMKVVGESNYQDALRGIAEKFGRGERAFSVRLVPDPGNPHDPNAVAVMTDAGETLGYLERRTAEQFVSVLSSETEPLTVPAQLHGGDEERPLIGVVLDFSRVYRLAERRNKRKPKRPRVFRKRVKNGYDAQIETVSEHSTAPANYYPLTLLIVGAIAFIGYWLF